MKIRDVMTTDVATATSDTTLEDVAIMMRDEDTGAIPVLDGDDLVGIVTDRDIVIRCIAEGKDPVETTVDDVISENLETIEPDSDVDEAKDIMARRQIRRLPVVDDGRLVGMLSLGDIAVKTETDTADTLENVSEGVKASGTNAKRAGRSGSTRGGGTEANVREMGRKTPTRAGGGREESLREQGTRSRPTQGVRAGANDRNQGIGNRSRGEEQTRQSRVVGKRGEAKTGTRRRAS